MSKKPNEIRLFSLCEYVGCAKNEAGGNGAGNTETALDITAYSGGRIMPVEASIPILSVQATYYPQRRAKQGLTPKLRSLLHFIESYAAENMGVMPSYDNMRESMGLKSKSGVHRMVKSLEYRGHISAPRKARGISLTPKSGLTVTDALSLVLSDVKLSPVARQELERVLTEKTSWQSVGSVAARLVEGAIK